MATNISRKSKSSVGGVTLSTFEIEHELLAGARCTLSLIVGSDIDVFSREQLIEHFAPILSRVDRASGSVTDFLRNSAATDILGTDAFSCLLHGISSTSVKETAQNFICEFRIESQGKVIANAVVDLNSDLQITNIELHNHNEIEL